MKGIEMMLASMLGITPDQMQDTINNAVNLLSSLDQRLSAIETKVNQIHRELNLEDTAEISGKVIDHAEV